MARGKGKYGPKSKILVVLKSAHQKFLENALSKLIFSKVENGTPKLTYIHWGHMKFEKDMNWDTLVFDKEVPLVD